MYQRTRLWLGETEQKNRMKQVLSAVIDVASSVCTGKPERYYYHFMQNDNGQRRLVVNGSTEASRQKSWLRCSFQPVADRWRDGEIDTDNLKQIIDQGLANGVSSGLRDSVNY